MKKILKHICLFFPLILSLVTNLPADSVKTQWSFSSFGEDDYFHRPSDIEADFERSLIYIADAGNHRVIVQLLSGVQIVDHDGVLTRHFTEVVFSVGRHLVPADGGP